MVIRFSIIFGVLLAGALWPIEPAGAQAQRLFLFLRDGSVVVVEVETKGFQWRNVTDDLEVETISWKDLRQLNLIQNSVGQQVAQIEEHLQNLKSESYQEREAAEKALRKANMSGPFKFVIRAHMKRSRDAETIHRLRRVMESLDDVRSGTRPEFDCLMLKQTGNDSEAEPRMGDAFDFTIEGVSEGRTVKFERQQIASVVASNRGLKPVEFQPGFNPVKTFNKIDKTIFDIESELINFETDGSGNPVPLGKTLNNHFSGLGLLMRTEYAGYIQAIKYAFKHCPIESGDRCACPYDANTDKRLRGATILSFCTPGQPNTVAGVTRFGIFLERIEHSRDFVVEAYNQRGQMIGMVESTDQVCVFAGFESAIPITKIRISQNDALPELDRDIDSTYAFDCVLFDSPRPLPQLSPVSKQVQGQTSFSPEST